MTAIKTPSMDIWSIKPIPGFDVIKMKEEIQAEIYEETKDMTTEELLKYFRKGAEEFDRECEETRARLASTPRGMVQSGG